MNIKSCDNCGVVLDADKIKHPPLHDASGLLMEKTTWNGDEWVVFIECPVCKEDFKLD